MNSGSGKLSTNLRSTAALKTKLFAFALAIFAWALTGQAQDESAADEVTDPQTPMVQEQETPPANAEIEPDPDQSPFDYESSEEISEDRSVSFPVDI